jgi:hypothetical protein
LHQNIFFEPYSTITTKLDNDTHKQKKTVYDQPLLNHFFLIFVAMLLDQYKDFYIQSSFEGSKAFFSENPASQWDVKNYFKLTHNHLNKNKKYNNIMSDYVHDLEWLSNIEGLPNEVKVYVLQLKNEKKIDTHMRKFIVT